MRLISNTPIGNHACEGCPDVRCTGGKPICERRTALMEQERAARKAERDAALARELRGRIQAQDGDIHLRCGVRRLRISLGDVAYERLPTRTRQEPEWLTDELAEQFLADVLRIS